ncbi:MAG: hypothetical protein ABH886_08045 [Candidatus Desantisbacteria bacterium]
MVSIDTEKSYDHLITGEIRESGKKMMEKLRKGEIKRHTLLNKARNFTDGREKEILSSYISYIKHRNFYEIYELDGNITNE